MPTPKQMANLIPPKKGEVRNPKGRTKGSLNSKTIIKRLLELQAMEINPRTKKAVQMKGLDGQKVTYMEAIFTELVKKAVKGDINAVNVLMDRLEGKPTQTTHVDLPAGAVVQIGGKKIDDE